MILIKFRYKEEVRMIVVYGLPMMISRGDVRRVLKEATKELLSEYHDMFTHGIPVYFSDDTSVPEEYPAVIRVMLPVLTGRSDLLNIDDIRELENVLARALRSVARGGIGVIVFVTKVEK